MTKDELRVERSIQSLLRKCDIALAKSHPRAVENEKRFEQFCYDNGLLYSPRNVLF